MLLNGFVAEKRARLFAELVAGHTPGEGSYDPVALAACIANGPPQMGATRYKPDAVALEFIYPGEAASSEILTVTLATPQRVVFMPVPPWVVESIWQGEIDGSYCFEDEARQMLAEFATELDEDKNRPWFGPRKPKRRD